MAISRIYNKSHMFRWSWDIAYDNLVGGQSQMCLLLSPRYSKRVCEFTFTFLTSRPLDLDVLQWSQLRVVGSNQLNKTQPFQRCQPQLMKWMRRDLSPAYSVSMERLIGDITGNMQHRQQESSKSLPLCGAAKHAKLQPASLAFRWIWY